MYLLSCLLRQWNGALLCLTMSINTFTCVIIKSFHIISSLNTFNYKTLCFYDQRVENSLYKIICAPFYPV